jgi:hypothetical protein
VFGVCRCILCAVGAAGCGIAVVSQAAVQWLSRRIRCAVGVRNAVRGCVQDIVYPTEIVGKRLRVRQDGGKTLKVHLNPKERVNVEGKVDTFASVYKNLCKKDIVFEFPVERE